jgi:arginyl-tRNA synthetase
MKSREGTVVDADDLVQELIELAEQTTKELGKVQELPDAERQKLYHNLGLGALKYFLLKVDPRKTMLFNPEESLALNGDTATYIQFNYARTVSILREASLQNIDYGQNTWKNVGSDENSLNPIEQNLIQLLNEYPQKINSACEELSPSVICAYSYDLAKLYSRFFHDLSIFKAETTTLRSFRVALSAEVGKVLKTAMGLLGVEMPERM